MISTRLNEIYGLLLEAFGDQDWWPGDGPFEVAMGAILTQNTNWSNVEKAIANLKKAGIMSAEGINDCPTEQLAELIKPAGYFNIKAKRIKSFVRWLFENCHGQIENLANRCVYDLREELLGIKGIGRETADSIILYAIDKPTFVVDTYTARVFIRHHLIDEFADYEQIKELFEGALPQETAIFNQYHALIVALGKKYCKKSKPDCANCPLNHLPHTVELP